MEENKNSHPEKCLDCGGELAKVYQPADSPLSYDQWAAVRRGDVRCSGECRKYYFIVNGVLKPGHND